MEHSTGKKLSCYKLKNLLKSNFSMRYQMSNTYIVNCNTKPFKMQRHFFADTLLEAQQNGFGILNYDESSLDHFCFKKRCWKELNCRLKIVSK